MFRASKAHHQEVNCMYVAKGTSKMTVNESMLADSHFRSTIYHIHISYLLMMGF
jgi:hypothetical protein